MSTERYALEELVKAYNENNKEAARLSAMHADVASEMYAWAVTVTYGIIRNVWVENRHYRLDVVSDTCPFGTYKYAKLEVLTHD